MLDTTLNDQVTQFLDAFGAALEAGDIARVTDMFEEDCYWRDLVTFTWNIKTVEGRTEIADMLTHQLAATRPTGWRTWLYQTALCRHYRRRSGRHRPYRAPAAIGCAHDHRRAPRAGDSWPTVSDRNRP